MIEAKDYARMEARIGDVLTNAAAGTTVVLGPFLGEVAGEVMATASHDPEDTQLTQWHPGAATLPAPQAMAVGLIVGELVGNAVAHAHPAGAPGRIAVRTHDEAAGVAIEVCDDGVGLPETFDPLTDGGLGLSAVRALARGLGARLSFASSDLGLTVRLDVPAAHHNSAEARA